MANKSYNDLWTEIEDSGWIELILEKIKSKVAQDKVSEYTPAAQIHEKFDFSLSESSSNLNDVRSQLLNYMDNAINTQSPYFVNQLYGGAHPIAVVSEWVNAFMNTSMATYEIAPMATIFEKQILKSLADLMNWPTHDGLMVPGGSYANMMALHLSRFAQNPAVKLLGHNEKNIVYISDQAHYSTKKAAHLLGYGENQVRVVASDEKFRMNTEDLQFAIEQDLAAGFKPTLVVSTLGTTVFGAIDPIAATQQVCEKFKLWHHVDGAWGGPLVFSDESIRKALSLVDSVTFDFHKLLGGTLTKAIFITQKEGLLSQANSCAGTQYIFHEDEDSFFDTGTKAIQCGRKVDSLSLWMTWKFLGNSGYRTYVTDLMKLREHALKLVKKYDYQILHEPEYLNICFKVPFDGSTEAAAQNSAESNSFQKLIRRELIKEGHVLVNYSSSEQHGVFFRLVLNHLRLNEKVLDRIFEIISQTQQKLLVQSNHLSKSNQSQDLRI